MTHCNCPLAALGVTGHEVWWTLFQDELYSSRIRVFAVYGRQNHPRAEGPDYGSHLNASAWQLLGNFTAANTKGTQVRIISYIANAFTTLG